jgi:ribosomal-protein-alanine N-acetyltransferase
MMPRLRPGTLDDLLEIARLHGECFADKWDVEFLGRVLAQPGAFSAVAVEDGRPVGFVVVRANAGEAEILSLGVRPPSRRRAIAKALVHNALDRAFQAGAVEVFLEVGIDNTAARGLYGILGFHEVGRRPAYYRLSTGPGVDALILRYSLPG